MIAGISCTKHQIWYFKAKAWNWKQVWQVAFGGFFRAMIFISCCLKFNWVPVSGFLFLCPSSTGKIQTLRAEGFLCTQVIRKTLVWIKILKPAPYDSHGHKQSTKAPHTFTSKGLLTLCQKKMHVFGKENKTCHQASMVLSAACSKHFSTNVILAIPILPFPSPSSKDHVTNQDKTD